MPSYEIVRKPSGGSDGQALIRSAAAPGGVSWASVGSSAELQTQIDDLANAVAARVRIPAGGSDGQVLAKNSATVTGSEWVAQSGGAGLQSQIDTLTTAVAARVITPSGGSNGQMLVKSGTAVAWANSGSQAQIDSLVASVAAKRGKEPRVLMLQEGGYATPGEANSTAGIQAAITEINGLTGGRGGILWAGPGVFNVDKLPSALPYVVLAGVQGAGHRYWGYNASNMPPALTAFNMRDGAPAASSGRTAMWHPDSTYTAGSLQHVMLLGNNANDSNGNPINGIIFDPPSTEHGFFSDNVTIVGFTGTGITGRLFAQEWRALAVFGCHEYGMSCESTIAWADVKFNTVWLNGNRLGNWRFVSSGSCGKIRARGVRIERAGWHPTNQTLIDSGALGAFGLQIAGNLKDSYFEVESDANSGYGVDIQRVSGRNVFNIKVEGTLNRDGWGDMTGATAPDYAGLRIKGFSLGGGSNFLVANIDVSGLQINGGKARDDGAGPTYYHPLKGADITWTDRLQWFGGGVMDAGIAQPLPIPAGGWRTTNYKSRLDMKIGNGQLFLPPMCENSTDYPGQTTDRGPAIKGMIVFDNALGKWMGCTVDSTANGSPGTWVVLGTQT